MQDLWADYAGEALATVEAGGGGGLRRRRLTEQATLMALRAWLLRDYMLPYGASLGATRIFQRCYWLDGLGSPHMGTAAAPLLAPEIPEATGKRGRQKPVTPDAPLPLALQLASETARQLARLERPITLYSFALDDKRGRRKTAQGAHAPAGQARNGIEPSAGMSLPKAGGLLPASWPELAPALLAALGQSATVFLLNPLKDGLFRYPDLAPLYQRTAPTELFLWLSHKQLETRLLPALRAPAEAAALTNLLRGDRWKGLLAQEAVYPERALHGLVELLAESMRPHFLSVQQLAFPMRGGPALVEAAPYSLLFATRRQDSLFSLNDAICKRARQLLAESQRGTLNEEWFSAQRAEQSTAQMAALTQETLALGRAQRMRRWPDLRLQLLLKRFGQQTLEEYDQIIASLLARNEVSCEWRKQTGEAAIPGNEDVLLWRG
ncbi:MAG TPA: hypothetical protein VN729_07840 [Ktedonobacteraceae bacterium]|nr:hypothetical protein [Ktedonobacteraceae bacterium]